jgi:hypothetical protein
MPTPARLEPLEINFDRGYFPSAAELPPVEFIGTIRRGSNVWLRSTGRAEVANGLLELSSQNVGARIFAADVQRATIAGGLVGSRLPYAGLIRYDNNVLLFLSEVADAQLYLNETAVSGVTTSPTAGRLRVAIPNGSGGYDDFDAGFDKPATPNVTVGIGITAVALSMSGYIGVALAAWRSKTNAIGPPSDIVFNNVAPSATENSLNINLPSVVSGQDGWIFCGTRWGDQTGELHVVRYIYRQPRGTVSVSFGTTALFGTGTFWTRDLRRGDTVIIDSDTYTIETVTSDTSATITPAKLGSGFSGTMTITVAAGTWFDAELGALISRDTFKPPRAAGILKYAGRVLLFGVPDTTRTTSASSPTGNAVVALLPNNPEHVGLLAIGTQSGSDIVNALGADGPLYLMTTTSLEIVSFTSDPEEPYKIKIIAEPGFRAATNGVLDADYFYGFNGMPFRTRADKNIDLAFAEPVQKIMKAWDGARVMLAVDPINKAVLYMFDNGVSTVVLPWMTQLGAWGSELNFSARIIDSQVVNGKLDVTYLSGGNYRVNEWEGGAGIGGTRYVASQYYDPRLLAKNRVKRLAFAGKAGSLSVYAATEDAVVPDVSNLGAAAETFTLSDVDKLEPEIKTDIHGNAYAFRVDFSSNDGNIDKLVASGTPIGR